MSNTTTRVYLSTLDCGDTFDLDAINAYTPYVPAGHYCVKTVDYTDGTVEIQDTSTRTVYKVNNGMVVRVQGGEPMTTTPDTFHWRKLNADERAAIAAHLAREGYTGFMFIETHAGEFVPMVMERVENKPDTAQDTEE